MSLGGCFYHSIKEQLDINRPMNLISVIKTGLERGERHITSFQCEKIKVGNWCTPKASYVHFSPAGILFKVPSIVTGIPTENAIPLGSIVCMYQNLTGNTYFMVLVAEGSVTAALREKLEFTTIEAKRKRYFFGPNYPNSEVDKKFITFKLVEKDIQHRVYLLNQFYIGKIVNIDGYLSHDQLYSRVMGSNNSSTIRASEISDSDDEPEYVGEKRCVPVRGHANVPNAVDKGTETDLEEITVIPPMPKRPLITLKVSMSNPQERIIPIRVEGRSEEQRKITDSKYKNIWTSNPFQRGKSWEPVASTSKQNPTKSDIIVIDIEDSENADETDTNDISVIPATPPTPPSSSSSNISPSRPRERIIPITLQGDSSSCSEGQRQSHSRNTDKNAENVQESPVMQTEVCEPGPSTSILNEPKCDVIQIDDSDQNSAESQSKISKTLFRYPRNDQDDSREIVIGVADVEQLRPTLWLNDVLIDFWCRYIYLEVLDINNQKRTHLFSSFFYEAIFQAFKKVSKEDWGNPSNTFRDLIISRWTKTIKLFEKDFIFVPVNDCSHWVLAVICFPGLVAKMERIRKRRSMKLDNFRTKVKRRRLVSNYGNGSASEEEDNVEEEKRPCILILDSLRDPDDKVRARIFKIVRTFLQNEWNLKNEDAVAFTETTMPGYFLDVPRQNNGFDCGLYILKFFELFFQKPIQSYKQPLPDKSKWFSPEEALSLRSNLYKGIVRYMEKYCPETIHLAPRIQYSEPQGSSNL